MAEGGTPKPTGRRVRGYISDLIELSAERALWTAVVYHEDYRADAALEAAAASVQGFNTQSSVGVARLRLMGPGVFGFATGEVRCTRELMGAATGGVGWAATVDWLIGALQVLQGAAVSGLASHGSLDPHRILIQYDGAVQVVGFGLPRLDLVDFLDDATLLPVTESLRFTAPESLEGAAEDFTTDLFILGLIAVELATGDPVYDAKEPAQLLARAADGEGRAALEGRGIPPSVLAWLGPMLEPWPDERHGSIAAVLEAASACRDKLSGPTLGEAMEANGDIASSVEIDLPRGWKLPAAEVLELPVDPEVFARDREARVTEAQALLPPLEEALKQVDKALAKLASPPDWSDTAEADGRRAEARNLGDRARQAARDARDVVGRMERAGDAAELEALAETLDEAVAQARGGAEEGARTAASALNNREAALAALAEKNARHEQEQALQKAFEAAREQLATWKEEVAPLAAHDPAPRLAHADDASVANHISSFEQAARDLEIAVSTLQGIQLEEGDDPDAVLDAARGHLDAARACRQRLDDARTEAIQADRAAAAALDAAAAAEAESRRVHRAALQASGERVQAAYHRVQDALDRAEAAAEGFEDELAAQLKPLRERAGLLGGRHENWTEMASVADDDTTAEALEDLVHTGNAEADFAEADLEDLQALVQAFDTRRDQVVSAREAYEKERHALLERLEVARGALATAEQQVAIGEAFRVPEDIGPEPIQTQHQALVAAVGPAREVLEQADAVIVDTDKMPDAALVSDLEQMAARATERGAASTQALDALESTIEGIRKQRLEAEEAHRAAVDRALALQQELMELVVERTPPSPDGDGDVAARLEADRQAVVVAQQAFPAAPRVAIEEDPVAAIGSLETALGGARKAATQLATAETHLAKRTKAVRALVAQLAKVAAKAEGVADETASMAGRARELKVETQGRWPALQKQARALEQAIAAVEARASEASEAAEASASADDVEVAKAQAKRTEEAHAAAKKALSIAQDRAGALTQAVEQARAAQAASDLEAHAHAVATAAELAAEASALLEQLEQAIQRAGELLENSPSQKAREAWEEAEPVIDATQERLAAVERLQQAVIDAEAPDQAQKALTKIVAAVEPSRQAVQEAVAAAEEAGRLAEAETEANVVLHEGLHKEAEEVAEHLKLIHEAVEHGQSHGGVKGIPAIVRKLEQQLAHAQDAVAAVAAGITAVNDADGEQARTRAAKLVRNEIARVVAAKNTARALRDQLDAGIEEAARAEQEQHQAAIAQGLERVESAQPLLEQVRAAAEGLAELRAHEHLAVPFRALDGAVVGCEPLLAGLVKLANELEQAETARQATRISRQIDQKAQELEQAHLDAMAAVAAVRDAHQDHLQAVAAERQQRVKEHRAAVSTVREAHRKLAGWLARVESDLAGAAELELEPADDVSLVRDEVGRMALFLDGLPGELGPEGLETAREVAEGVQGAIERVETAVEAFQERLERARTAAHALAGIRGAATAVRQRYASLENQLTEAHEGLQRVSERAPVAGASQDHREAADQLEELTTTLAEANTSLDDLNNATDADEAQALLEVAEASLDIAGSLFEFALPMVQRTIEAGEAEVRAMMALEERRKQAETALTLAMQDLPAASAADERIAAAQAATLHLEGAFGAEALQDLLKGLAETGARWNEARAVLEHPVEVSEGADALEAVAKQRTTERSALQQAEVALERLLVAIQEQVASVEAMLDERAGRVERAQTQLEAMRKALALVQDQAARGLDEANEAAAGVSVQAVLQALRAVQDRASELAAASLPEVDSDDPQVAEAALLEAEQTLDEARTSTFDDRVQALHSAIEVARAEQAERVERLTQLRSILSASQERLIERKEAFEEGLKQAERSAEPWPLETMEPLEALRAAADSVASATLPEVPDGPDDPTPERVAQITALATTLQGSLEQAEAHDLEPLLEAVRTAVAAGERAAQHEKEALQGLQERIQQAGRLLASRQAKAGEQLFDVAELLEMPELEALAGELQAAVEAFSQLAIPASIPETLEEASPLAEQAEAIATTESAHVELFERLQQAARQAEAERADLRDRIRTAAAAVEARLEAGREMQGRYQEQAGSERLKATLRAVEEAVEQLASVHFEIDVDALDRAALEEAADEAELAVQAVALIDIEGLEEEANDALRKDAEEAARIEKERATTQEQASAAVDAALLQLTMEVEARRDSVADLDESGAGGSQAAPYHQKAREALAEAQSIMENLEALQARLVQPMPMAEAVSASFDAESQAEIAVQHLDTVDEAVKAAQNETQALARILGQYPRVAHRLTELLVGARQVLAELPEPEGEMAASVVEALGAHGKELARLDGEASSCVAALEESSNAMEAEAEFDRLRGLVKQAQGVAREIRNRANDLHEAIETERQLEAARRAESFAEGRRRAELALKRAETAADAVGAAVVRVNERAGGLGAAAEEARSRLAGASESALSAVDHARTAVSAADDDLEAPEAAVQAADAAEGALAVAEEAEAEVGRLLEAARQAELEEAERRQGEILARRDELLPGLNERAVAVRDEVDDARRVCGSPFDDDEEAEVVRAHALSTVDHAAGLLETALERLGLLAQAKPEDVDDFIEDAGQAVQAAEQSLGAVRSARIQLDEAAQAAELRGRALALEEARGRAWEACQLAQRLAKDLTMARNALPPLPNPPPPAFREAVDRLAEVERRLWRAGQRADEARERAGSTEDLEQAETAAAAAETAVGSARRWEKEIDGALDQLSNLLKGPGYTGVREIPPPEVPAAEEPEHAKQSRIEKLRRGRNRPDQTDARDRLAQVRDSRPPFAPVPENPTGNSPTEKLLQRLRKGRARGETGRERLKRLRDQRRSQPTHDPEATEFPSVGEVEEQAATVAASDAEVQRVANDSQQRTERRDQRAELIEAMKKKQEQAADEGRTQVFTREHLAKELDDDAATQMFTRDMLDEHLAGELEDEEDDPVTRESDGPPVWADEDGSTKYSTMSPRDLRERDEE